MEENRNIFKTRNKLYLNKYHQQVYKKKRKVTLKKKVRDMRRLFTKIEKSGQSIDPLKKRELDELARRLEIQEREIQYAKKYQKYKFYDLKKLNKMKRKFVNLKQEEGQDLEKLNIDLKEIEKKIDYVKYFPKGEKYISIIKKNEDEKNEEKKKIYFEKIPDLKRKFLFEEGKRKDMLKPLDIQIEKKKKNFNFNFEEEVEDDDYFILDDQIVEEAEKKIVDRNGDILKGCVDID